MSHFGFAERLAELERQLVYALKLEPLRLGDGLEHLEGNFKGTPASMATRAYAGPGVRYARFVHLHADSLEIANLLCLPALEHALPIFGVDLVALGGEQAIAVADLSPVLGEPAFPVAVPAHTLPGAGELPAWSRAWFSPQALFARASATEATRLSGVLAAYADAWIAAAGSSRPEPARADRVLAAHDAYLLAHLEHDRGLQLLKKIFEPARAEQFLTRVMFPTQRRASRL